MTRRVNLDERLAAARAEQTSEPKALTWRGREWVLPDDVPLEFAEISAGDMTGRMLDGVVALLGDDVRTLRPRVGVEEAVRVLEAITELYGTTVGESDASG